jgi:hypothetical protein
MLVNGKWEEIGRGSTDPQGRFVRQDLRFAPIRRTAPPTGVGGFLPSPVATICILP